MSALSKILRRDWKDRVCFVEALCWLGVAKVVVHTIPFRVLSRSLGVRDSETDATFSPAARAIAVQVSWAVQTAARYVPLGFVCLPQALAAWRMLRRRGLPTTLYFGVATDPQDGSKLLTHAWLRAGDKIVTGEHRAGQYVGVANFADDHSPRLARKDQ